MTPSEGELFKKILGAEWGKLHPDIQARFDKNPLPGKPLYYAGRLSELRCSRLGWMLGYLSRPFLNGALMPHNLSVRDGNLHFESDGYFWQVFGVRIPLLHIITPGKTFLCHRNNRPNQFDIRIEIRHPLFGTTFTQAGVFAEVAHPLGGD